MRLHSRALLSQLFASVSVVQDIGYVYDAVGNILKLADAALATVFYDNQQVTPECAYTYDALYRLIDASGRESIGQTDFAPDFGNTRDFPFVGSALNPNDLQALRRFTESYAYDDAGNLLSLAHTGWTRDFTYAEASQLEAGKVSNRLTSTTVGASTNSSAYDVHGNMLGLPHVSSMAWNFKDEFQQANLGGGGTAYYVYDSAGQRVRKVLESQLGVRRSERLYLGGFEVWREYQADGVTVETARETLHVMDDKQRIALVETLTVEDGSAVVTPTPRLRYQLGNHLGSSSVELDEVAALISYEEYHPYGTTALQAHNTSAEGSLKRYRYTAKERDDETGLNYHGARYYAPWLARWTACDPAIWQLWREARGAQRNMRSYLNPFVGMSNNPITFVDLDGKQDTGYTRYLDRQLKTAEGAKEAHETTKAGFQLLSLPPIAGTLQVVGGVLELLGAGSLLGAPEPTMTTKAAGYALGAHGIDSLQAGIRTLSTLRNTPTFTHEAGSATATALGASPEVANIAGAGADLLLSVGAGTAGALLSKPKGPVFFRGTNEGYAGSPGNQRIGVTPASTDPVVATVFATHSENFGEGIVLIASSEDLKGVAILEGNVLREIEKEVGVDLVPSDFAQKASVKITASEARTILAEMGHEIPPTVGRSPAAVDSALRETSRLSPEEVRTFTEKATRLFSTKKAP